MRQRLATLGKDGQEAADSVFIRLISNVEVGVPMCVFINSFGTRYNFFILNSV